MGSLIVTDTATGQASLYNVKGLAREAHAYCKQKRVKLANWHIDVHGASVALVVTYTCADGWNQQDRIAL
jgi:hypothetical protein